MQYSLSLSLLPAEAADERLLLQQVADKLSISALEINGYKILKQSIDARRRPVHVILQLKVFAGEPLQADVIRPLFQEVDHARHQVIIVGAGPAGLFAALKLIELGIKPVILERGKDVRSRRRDLAAMNKEGIVNPESNYCFGEGGAGTYSDGKLYTRSTKRGDVNRILQLFIHFGADAKIAYEAHPHIGTNKLPHIITAMRDQIIACGGEIHFWKKVTDFIIQDSNITGVITSDGARWEAPQVILCTGHSARDIFELLQRKKIQLTAKPFALGVRVEHPQALIDEIQYHCPVRDAWLPPASYSFVTRAGGKGVFSFCMCPGGIIAPAATLEGELVVNGWSPSKRNNPFANSGIVVSVDEKDWQEFAEHKALAAMYFQQSAEQKAWQLGGGQLVAPAQRMTDFVQDKLSLTLPGCSYLPGIKSAQISQLFPEIIYQDLQEAFRAFGKKMKGYFTKEAVVVATESRTSSPVRIPRDPETLEHPQVGGLYPCGEGAGYAGGIMSAAIDGEKIAVACAVKLKQIKE
jgi:uncharacterized protein